VGTTAGVGGKVVPCSHATWIWRGQANILGFDMEREREL
jgi:hypothetical protein